MVKPFKNPVYITQPLLPDLEDVNLKLKEIWTSKWLTNNGDQHKFLEAKLQNILKVPHLSLFNNGTIALIVAVQSLRLSGEVITTPFTFPATPHVLTWNNIKPIFCDIDATTLNIDTDKIESMISPHTTGILAVHVFGTPCNVKKIQKIADSYGLRVIYDAAHAFGSEVNDYGIGTYGDISMFSFHATKLFHTLEGGALTFNSPHLKKRIDLLKNFGIKNEEEVIMPGINGKMNEIQAAIGLILLNSIEDEKAQRKKILDIYKECLIDIEGIKLINNECSNINSYQYCVIRINKDIFGMSRDSVYSNFKKYNVFTRKYFHPLCSEYTCYRNLPSSSSDNLPVANKVVKEVLALPFYGELTTHNAIRICEILRSFRK